MMSHTGDHKLRQTLIERCDHLSDEVQYNRTDLKNNNDRVPDT